MKSLCLLLSVSALPAAAQIDNAGFEQWNAQNPLVWTTTNQPLLSVFNVTASTNAFSGGLAARGEVVVWNGATYGPALSHLQQALTFRPEAFTAWYQFHPQEGSADKLNVGVQILDADNVLLLYGLRQISAPAVGYTYLDIPLIALAEGEPARANLGFAVVDADGQPTEGTWFLVDDLAWEGIATEVPSHAATGTHIGPVHPLPVQDQFAVTLSLDAPSAVHASLLDPLGRVVSTFDPRLLPAGMHRPTWPRADGLPAGAYMLLVECTGVRSVQRVLLE